MFQTVKILVFLCLELQQFKILMYVCFLLIFLHCDIHNIKKKLEKQIYL